MEELVQAWVCAKCQHEQTRLLSPEVAAFKERSSWETTCPKCGHAEFQAMSWPRPTPTMDLFEEWAVDVNLSFLEQDEDLYMASADYVPFLEQFVTRRGIPEIKRATLLSALCVIIYENVSDANEPNDSEDESMDPKLGEHVLQFLKRNLYLFDEIDKDYLYGYIARDVLPRLGISLDEPT